jgi:hypothetical protein
LPLWYSLAFIYIFPPRSVHYTITALCVGKHPDLSNFIGYLPCGGKLGCSAGNNRVVSRQRKFWQSISIILLSHD